MRLSRCNRRWPFLWPRRPGLFGRPALPGSVPGRTGRGIDFYGLGRANGHFAGGLGRLAGLGQPGLGDGLYGSGRGVAGLGRRGVDMTYGADSAPQTLLALGDAAAPSASFTSEKMRGADAVFGPDNVAVVFPVGWSSILVGCG